MNNTDLLSQPIDNEEYMSGDVPDPTYSLEDIAIDTEPAFPIHNRKLTSNMASTVAAISGEQENVVQTYHDINMEYGQFGYSRTAESILDQVKRDVKANDLDSVSELLADQSLPDQLKLDVVKAWNDVESKRYEPKRILAEGALIEHDPETEEGFAKQINVTDSINEILDSRELIQQIQTSEAAKGNVEFGPALVDTIRYYMVPFVEGYQAGKIIYDDMPDQNVLDYVGATLMSGSGKAKISDHLKSLPPDDQVGFVKSLYDTINKSDLNLFLNGNDVANTMFAREILEGNYTSSDEVVDNAMSLLDILFLGRGKALSAIGKVGGLASEQLAKINNARRNSLRGQTGQTSIGQVYADTNPDKFKATVDAVFADPTDETAEALFQATREDVAAVHSTPQVGSQDNVVEANESLESPEIAFAKAEIDQAYRALKSSAATKEELQTAVDAELKKLEKVRGLTSRPAEFSIKLNDDGTTTIEGMYGPAEGTFRTEQEALDRVRKAFRNRGLPDSAFEAVKQKGAHLVPTNSGKYPGFADAVVVKNPAVHPDNDITVLKSLTDALNSGRYMSTTIKGGGQIRLVRLSDEAGFEHEILAVDDSGDVVGSLSYVVGEKGQHPSVEVSEAYRRKGVATAMYDLAEKTGGEIPPYHDRSAMRTEYGDPFRRARHENGSGKTSFSLGKANESYLVRVKQPFDFVPKEIEGKMSDLAPAKTWFDRVKGFVGNHSSVTRMLLDPNSIFHPEVTRGASIAVNKISYIQRQFLKLGDDVAKSMTKLPKDRQHLVIEILERANFLSRKPTLRQLKAAGISDAEIEAIQKFDRYWEFDHHVKNLDLAATYRARGYKVLVDDKNQTILLTKPVSKNAPIDKDNIKILDHETGQIRRVTREEIDKAYDSGGGLGKLEHPLSVGKERAEFVLSKNSDTSYFRDITDDTQLLNKREAYYPTIYKDPYFVVKASKGLGGEIYREAVGVAGSSVDAQKIVDKLKSSDPEGEYFFRADKKDSEQEFSNYRDTGSMGRMSSQRVRGNRLATIDNGNLRPDSSYIMNPIDAMIQSSRGLSNRIGMRSWIETTKQRYIQRYGDGFLESDGMGGYLFPTDVTQIADRGRKQLSRKLLGDARADFNYIHTMENGYINLMDDGLKSLLHHIGESFGAKAVEAYKAGNFSSSNWLSWFERKALEISKSSGPVELNRSLAFHLYLSLNPLRQFVIQGHQGLQVAFAYNPKIAFQSVGYVVALATRQSNFKVSSSMLKRLGIGMTEDQFEKFYRNFSRSGLVSSIDNHNMIGASLRGMTEAGMNSGAVSGAVMTGARAVSKAGRKVGFDAGEFVFKSISYSGAYLNRIAKGKVHGKFTQRELDDIATEADNLTLSMNRSGEMPYNQNFLSIWFQFQQAPHKMATLVTANRRMSKAQKGKMLAANMLAYGIPSTMLYGYLQDHGLQTSADLTRGLEDLILNRIIAFDFGEGANIDFRGNLSPFSSSVFSLASEVMSNPIGAFAKSPSMALWFGDGARITNLFSHMVMWSGVWDDPLGDMVDAEVVAKDLFNITSGTSNLFKSIILGYMGTKRNADGDLVLQDITKSQAVAQLFGLGSISEAILRYSDQETYKNSQDFYNDIETTMKNMNRLAASSGMDKGSAEYYLQAFAVARAAFGDDQVALKHWQRLMESDTGKEYTMNMLKTSPMQDTLSAKMSMRASVANGTPEEKEAVEQVIRDAESFIGFGDE